MNIRLSSVLGLALLAASLTFTSSFACSNRGDDQASIVSAPAAEVSEASVGELAQPLVAEAPQPSVAEDAQLPVAAVDAAEPPVAEAAPALAINESDPSATEEASAPAIYAVDAIHVEVTQTVTIAAPGQTLEDDQPAYTGSIGEEAAQPAVQSDEAIVAEGAQTVSVIVPTESAVDEQPTYTVTNEVAGSTADETAAAQPALLPEESKATVDSNEP
jgi:hypothetical protein